MEGSEASSDGPVGVKHDEGIELRERVNENPTDRFVGETKTYLRRRVRDGVLLRLIDKWLKAGVLEEGNLWYPDAGTPQGGVISPLLANVYLHSVLHA